jgi:enoyl-CoA hydratase
MDISIDRQEDVALITMDDGKKNAITQQALVDLNAAFDEAEAGAKAEATGQGGLNSVEGALS